MIDCHRKKSNQKVQLRKKMKQEYISPYNNLTDVLWKTFRG